MTYKWLMLILPLFFVQAAGTYNVSSIKIIGKTVELDLDEITSQKGESMGESRIKSIVASITGKYHDSGYTACYVDKVIYKKDGALEIYINEGRIIGIKISGNQRIKNHELDKIFVSGGSEIFNEKIIKGRVDEALAHFGLRSLNVSPERTREGGILLNVYVKERGGIFYGGIATDMIYGISPNAGYFYPLGESWIDMNFTGGYRDGELRRAEGWIKNYIFLTGVKYFFWNINGGRLVDTWETEELDYETIFGAPSIGLGIGRGTLKGNIFYTQRFINLGDYGKPGNFFDSRMNINFNLNNRDMALDKREYSYLDLLVSGGWDSLTGGFYSMMFFRGETSILPFMNLRIVPRINIWYTSSEERFFWKYVFDNSLIGFVNDFTASKWKNVAGLDVEVEISRAFLYLGPFINSGYFKNEENNFQSKTGFGLKSNVRYEKIDINLYYAWDINFFPEKKVFFFTLNGRF